MYNTRLSWLNAIIHNSGKKKIYIRSKKHLFPSFNKVAYCKS